MLNMFKHVHGVLRKPRKFIPPKYSITTYKSFGYGGFLECRYHPQVIWTTMTALDQTIVTTGDPSGMKPWGFPNAAGCHANFPWKMPWTWMIWGTTPWFGETSRENRRAAWKRRLPTCCHEIVSSRPKLRAIWVCPINVRGKHTSTSLPYSPFQP